MNVSLSDAVQTVNVLQALKQQWFETMPIHLSSSLTALPPGTHLAAGQLHPSPLKTKTQFLFAIRRKPLPFKRLRPPF